MKNRKHNFNKFDYADSVESLNMELEKWDKEEIIRYLQQSERGYAGDVSSPEIIRLSQKYIGEEIENVTRNQKAIQ
ncbi:MAG TPA: hypothetical protein HA348_07510 [Thermoplasmata archaeon]|nr:hypothetical protein [Thermoplasmata archaeon]